MLFSSQSQQTLRLPLKSHRRIKSEAIAVKTEASSKRQSKIATTNTTPPSTDNQQTETARNSIVVRRAHFTKGLSAEYKMLSMLQEKPVGKAFFRSLEDQLGEMPSRDVAKGSVGGELSKLQQRQSMRVIGADTVPKRMMTSKSDLVRELDEIFKRKTTEKDNQRKKSDETEVKISIGRLDTISESKDSPMDRSSNTRSAFFSNDMINKAAQERQKSRSFANLPRPIIKTNSAIVKRHAKPSLITQQNIRDSLASEPILEKEEDKASDIDDFQSFGSSLTPQSNDSSKQEDLKHGKNEIEERLMQRACEKLMSQVCGVNDGLKQHTFKKFLPAMQNALYAKKFGITQKVTRTSPDKATETKDKITKQTTIGTQVVLASLVAKTSFLGDGNSTMIHASRRISQDSAELSELSPSHTRRKTTIQNEPKNFSASVSGILKKRISITCKSPTLLKRNKSVMALSKPLGVGRRLSIIKRPTEKKQQIADRGSKTHRAQSNASISWGDAVYQEKTLNNGDLQPKVNHIASIANNLEMFLEDAMIQTSKLVKQQSRVGLKDKKAGTTRLMQRENFRSTQIDPDSGSFDLSKMTAQQRLKNSETILNESPLVRAWMMQTFLTVPDTVDSRFISKERRFDKRGMLEMYERKYEGNQGSQLLARGLVEHIFAVKQALMENCTSSKVHENATNDLSGPRQKKRPLKSQNNELTIDDLIKYLTSFLLTSNRQTQLQTAFTLYLYLSQKKITKLRKSCQQATCIDQKSSKENFRRTSSFNVSKTDVIEEVKGSVKSPATAIQPKLAMRLQVTSQLSDKKPQMLKKQSTQNSEDDNNPMAGHIISPSDDVVMTTEDLFNLISSPALDLMYHDCRVINKLFAKRAENLSTYLGNKRQECLSKKSDDFRRQRSFSIPNSETDYPNANQQQQRITAVSQQQSKMKLTKPQKQEQQQWRAMRKRVLQTYDAPHLMLPKDAKALRKSLTTLQRNRSEVELATEQRTGLKVNSLDKELLQTTFTPYKLKLIEQTSKMKGNTVLLNNLLGEKQSTTAENLSKNIQKKAVMKKYRERSSACSLYALVDQNTEYFVPSDDDGTNKRSDKCEKLIKQVSCPLNLKVEKKYFEQGLQGKMSSGTTVKKGFIKITNKPAQFKNPWERTAKIQPDGTFKIKQGLESIMLTKQEKENFSEALKRNQKLTEFRHKVAKERKETKRKYTDCLSMRNFLTLANFKKSEGTPEIIIFAVYLLVGKEVLKFYFEKLFASQEEFTIEEWPKQMPEDPAYFLFCHKQIRKDLNVDNPMLMPRSVIRRDLSAPMVMQTFRMNALQHARFFHDYLGQSVSYNQIIKADFGTEPVYEVHKMLLNRVDPLFSQLCDPYSSYNEGVFGITLRQLTQQSELLFGVLAPFFAERLFRYLLKTQEIEVIRNNGGFNRFRQIETPRDYITYQTWLDFCFDCCRPNMIKPFDKRGIEIEMLDRMNLFSIDMQDVKRLEEGIQQSFPAQKRYSISRKLTKKTLSNIIPRQQAMSNVAANVKQFQNKLTKEVQDFENSSKSSSENNNVEEGTLESRKEMRKKLSDAEFEHKSQYNMTLKSVMPPGGSKFNKFIVELKYALHRKQKNMAMRRLSSSPERTPTRDATLREPVIVETKEREHAQLFKEDYIAVVNYACGKDESPILDIIAWHIHRASLDIINFNEE